MSNRRLVAAAILSPCMFMLSACGTPSKQTAPSIGYIGGILEQKYRVCREDCPRPTPKELDDAEGVQPAILVDASQSNQKTLPTVAAAPESDAQSTNKNSSEDTFQIHFDFGMSKPNLDGQKELLRFAAMTSMHGVNKIVLIGQTDSIGTQIYNTGLANKRADFVGRWIKSHGIDAEILTTGKAECCHPVPYNKAALSFAEMRRVTIHSE